MVAVLQMEKSLTELMSAYTLLFNGKSDIDPSKEDNSFNYGLPSALQVGQIVEVRVGHIDRFKIGEELQLNYHLKQAGFLKMKEQLEKQKQQEF